jgi:heme A synthase
MSSRGFRRFSIGVLVYNLGVILWGAYVRASNSGAGCGRHWPTCNGEIIPMDAQLKTLIEFTHRATSGLALLSVVALVAFAFHVYPAGSPVRKGALAALFFMLTEAAVGAGLVLLELVAGNKSIARAEFMALHLTNTFLLLASLALTIFWAAGGRELRWTGQGLVGRALAVALVGMVLLGISGAITALGDTLFPAQSLAEGMRQDFSATAHIFLRLRRWHPVIALLMDLYVTGLGLMLMDARPRPAVRRAAVAVMVLFFGQLCLGVVNLLLLAPTTIQMLHLLTADLVWLALVFLAAGTLEEAAVEPAVPLALSVG